jgi:hypothetical protein
MRKGLAQASKWICAQQATFSLIQRIELVTDGTIEFSNIPQGFTTLRIVVYGASTYSATTDSLMVQFNSDTGTNYDQADLRSVGGVVSGTNSGATSVVPQPIGSIAGADAPAGALGVTDILISDYSNGAFWKVASSSAFGAFGSGSVTSIDLYTVVWHSTDPITDVLLYSQGSGPLAAGSAASLFGQA